MAVANGRIDTANLTAIPARYYSHGEGAYLRADAAASFLRLAAAFERAFGKPLVCISFYRTYERQRSIFLERYTRRPSSVRSKVVRTDRIWDGSVWRLAPGRAASATPGLSNHGLGQAVDFHAGVQTAGSPEHRWFQANAPAYGWDWTEGRRNGEPWHWTYETALDRHKRDKALSAGTTKAAATTAAPAPGRVATIRDVQAALAALGYDPGPADGTVGTKTRAAVRAYQADAGLSVDGIAGSTTRTRMEADMAKLDDIQKTLARHSQILEALDVRTGNSQSGRLAQAADRILGILPQRYGADKKPARILDTLDGDTLRQDIRDAVKQIKGA